jgi:hypothetical protein
VPSGGDLHWARRATALRHPLQPELGRRPGLGQHRHRCRCLRRHDRCRRRSGQRARGTRPRAEAPAVVAADAATALTLNHGMRVRRYPALVFLAATQWQDLKDKTVLAYCAYGLSHLGAIPGLRARPSDQEAMVPTGELTRAYLVAPDQTFVLVPLSRAPAAPWPCMPAAGPAGG